MNLVSPKKAVSLKEASRFWLQLGLMSFGGAYAVLPYVAQVPWSSSAGYTPARCLMVLPQGKPHLDP